MLETCIISNLIRQYGSDGKPNSRSLSGYDFVLKYGNIFVALRWTFSRAISLSYALLAKHWIYTLGGALQVI